MKSSWTSCAARRLAALSALAGVALLAAGCAGGGAATGRGLAELTNPFLGPEHSQWLVGAVARLATPEEIDAYLALRDDAAAAEFIRGFWARRDPNPAFPDNPLLETFEKRAAEADRLYSESGVVGRRTARGTIHILYGPAGKVEFEVSPHPDDPPIEAWTYEAGAAAGLDGKSPSRLYRFIRRGDLTIFYVPRGDQQRRLSRDPSRVPRF